MDQASSILSLSNHALYISFYPSLSPQTIPVLQTTPPTTFIIANSLKTADKVVSSKIHYNLRVVETLVAARVLAKGLGVKGVLEKQKITLREVLGLWIDEGVEGASEDKLEKALKDIDEEVEKILGSGNGKQGLTMDEMIEASGLEKTVFNEVYLSWVEGA
jgi:galactokinase